MKDTLKIRATGRRKTSSARVSITPGAGNIFINGKDPDSYFNRPILKMIILQPLQLTKTEKKYDINVNVVGGGIAGQAGAVRHGITRALIIADLKLRAVLKAAGLLTRDSRMKERKKYGQKKARKRFQFSKR